MSQNTRTVARCIVTAVVILSAGQTAWADCDMVQPTRREFTVISCRVVQTDKEPALQEFLRDYPAGFVESAQAGMRQYAQSVVESYRGAVLAVSGEGLTGRLFVRSHDPYACAAFPSRSRKAALIGGQCCDGDSNPPCFLGFKQYIVPGTAQSVP